MELKTQRHTTDVLWVEVPLGIGFTEAEFNSVMEAGVQCNVVPCLRDGISVNGDTLPEVLDDLDFTAEEGEPVNQKIYDFILAVTQIQPFPDEYFFHL